MRFFNVIYHPLLQSSNAHPLIIFLFSTIPLLKIHTVNWLKLTVINTCLRFWILPVL